jgi:hypothetical protein
MRRTAKESAAPNACSSSMINIDAAAMIQISFTQ